MLFTIVIYADCTTLYFRYDEVWFVGTSRNASEFESDLQDIVD